MVLLEECAAALDGVVGLFGALAVAAWSASTQRGRLTGGPPEIPKRRRRVVCGWAQSVQAGRGATCAEQTRVGKDGSNGKVRTGHATSLDGFIAGPNDGSEDPWVRVASGFWVGTLAVTPSTGCLARRWCSRSRRRPPSSFARRAQRQGRW